MGQGDQQEKKSTDYPRQANLVKIFREHQGLYFSKSYKNMYFPIKCLFKSLPRHFNPWKASYCISNGHFPPPVPPNERQEGRLLPSAPSPAFMYAKCLCLLCIWHTETGFGLGQKLSLVLKNSTKADMVKLRTTGKSGPLYFAVRSARGQS